jgi:hypothetical protein
MLTRLLKALVAALDASARRQPVPVPVPVRSSGAHPTRQAPRR